MKESLHPKELVGRLGGVRFGALLERGNEHDIMSERLLARVAKKVMRVKDKSVSVTCTIGLSIVSPGDARLDALLADAMESARKGITRGGNQSITSDRADNDSRVMSYDQVWVKHIKAALMENRFRLVQQPIASLQGDDPRMFDVLVRMIDNQGKEVLPVGVHGRRRTQRPAEEHRPLGGGRLAVLCRAEDPRVPVRAPVARDRARRRLHRLARQPPALQPRATAALCFQVTEETAATYVPQVKALATALRERRFRFALEGFGSGRNSAGMLDSLPLDFVKIDGTLVQGLAGDPQLQQRVRMLVEVARKNHIQTVAERVEDANTMAVLWQIGVQYIQGYFVNEPEEVVLHG